MESKKSKTKETRFPQHDEFLFSSPYVVLEKSGYCNAVTVARFLPLVHASAENGKDPLHERRGWLHQCDILRNIVPVRKPVPTVKPEFPSAVCRGMLVFWRSVVCRPVGGRGMLVF